MTRRLAEVDFDSNNDNDDDNTSNENDNELEQDDREERDDHEENNNDNNDANDQQQEDNDDNILHQQQQQQQHPQFIPLQSSDNYEYIHMDQLSTIESIDEKIDQLELKQNTLLRIAVEADATTDHFFTRYLLRRLISKISSFVSFEELLIHRLDLHLLEVEILDQVLSQVVEVDPAAPVSPILLDDDDYAIHNNFETMLFFETCISNEAMEYLCQIHCNLLKTFQVDFIRCRINDFHAKCLGTALPYAKVKILHLSDNQISDCGIKALASGLQYNTSLQVLNLSQNKFGDDGVGYLFQSLAANENNATIELDLSGNEHLTFESAKHIAKHLPCTKLQKFDLNSCKIGDVGVQYIAQSLNKSQLQILYLSQVGITSYGVEYLATALQSNTVLQYLSIYTSHTTTNNILQGAMEKLCQTLKDHNKTLKGLGWDEEIVATASNFATTTTTTSSRCSSISNEKKNTTPGLTIPLLKDRIDFFLELNNWNRQQICQSNITAPLFPFILQNISHNPSIMYWIIQTFPHNIIMYYRVNRKRPRQE